MKSYHSSLTISYKTGYIYSAVIDGQVVVKYQVDKYAYVQYCKSIHAAKIIITKAFNKVYKKES